MLDQEHAAQLGERVVERPKNRLTIRDRQREDDRLAVVRRLELLGYVVEVGLSEQPCELEYVLIGDGNAGQVGRPSNSGGDRGRSVR